MSMSRLNKYCASFANGDRTKLRENIDREQIAFNKKMLLVHFGMRALFLTIDSNLCQS